MVALLEPMGCNLEWNEQRLARARRKRTRRRNCCNRFGLLAHCRMEGGFSPDHHAGLLTQMALHGEVDRRNSSRIFPERNKESRLLQ
jgi:hypothetical protein